MKKHIIVTTIIALAAAHCPAAPVELPDNVGFAVESVASGDEPFAPWSFAATDSRDPALSADVADGGVEVEKPDARIPIALQGGTGQETRLGVDYKAIDERADREGWATWKKWTVVGVSVVAVSVAAVLIVEATQRGSHSSGDDSSEHLTATVGGSGNSLTINYHSPSTANTRTRTDNSTYGGGGE